MKFSLILATIGRHIEVEGFLAALDQQTHRDIELIVVDQNTDDRVQRLLSTYALDYQVRYLRSTPGLSAARNVGLRAVTGEVVAFPDDDCWYPPDLLQRVSHELQRDLCVDGVTGRSIDSSMQESGGSFSKTSGVVDLYGVWSRGISYTIFLRRSVCDLVGTFDESLGVGAKTPFASGEETDFLIRAIKQNRQIVYLPSLKVFHPNTAKLDAAAIRKGMAYGMGMGRVLAKHAYPTTFLLSSFLRPLIGSVVAAIQLKRNLSRYRFFKAIGRYRGFFSDGKYSV